MRVLGVLLLLSSFASTADAQAKRRPGGGNVGGWIYLGERFVDGRRDTDKLPVSANGAFRAIQLRVSGSAVNFDRVVVHFENGADTDLQIRDRIPAGGMTRAIDLPGDRRRIQSVEMWYSKAHWRHRPGVKVYGRR